MVLLRHWGLLDFLELVLGTSWLDFFLKIIHSGGRTEVSKRGTVSIHWPVLLLYYTGINFRRRGSKQIIILSFRNFQGIDPEAVSSIVWSHSKSLECIVPPFWRSIESEGIEERIWDAQRFFFGMWKMSIWNFAQPPLCRPVVTWPLATSVCETLCICCQLPTFDSPPKVWTLNAHVCHCWHAFLYAITTCGQANSMADFEG